MCSRISRPVTAILSLRTCLRGSVPSSAHKRLLVRGSSLLGPDAGDPLNGWRLRRGEDDIPQFGTSRWTGATSARPCRGWDRR